jgi:histidinol-phosphatase (PHP family)
MPPPLLPPDDHTHSEWSWDATAGSMLGSCERAAALGLPSIAFTEHVDVTRWVLPTEVRDQLTRDAHRIGHDGRFDPPPLDVDGYLASIATCRARFPELRIVTGVEVGEPHWFAPQTRALLASGAFERVLGSLHSVPIDGRPWMVDDLLGPYAPGGLTAADAVRAYLVEAAAMVRSFPDEVQVLAHIDYPVRRWVGGFDPAVFEEEFREVLTVLAASGRALEINTRVPLAGTVVAWWRDVGGRAVTFGSDAHEPSAVAYGFAEAAAVAEANGFRPDRDPHGTWHR